MPTEHEYKFILQNDLDFFSNIQSKSSYRRVIEQGCLNCGDHVLRIRKSEIGCIISWYFTFKLKTDRVIEIEKLIDERDGEELLSLCSDRLKKIRYEMPDGWEIDFYLDQNICYFVSAEKELPEGSSPPELPDYLVGNLIYSVPLTDDRFSNKKLTDLQYAKNIYKSLKGEQRCLVVTN